MITFIASLTVTQRLCLHVCIFLTQVMRQLCGDSSQNERQTLCVLTQEIWSLGSFHPRHLLSVHTKQEAFLPGSAYRPLAKIIIPRAEGLTEASSRCWRAPRTSQMAPASAWVPWGWGAQSFLKKRFSSSTFGFYLIF